MGRILGFIAISGLLAGCAGITERQMAVDDAKCTSMGAIKGTQPYLDCRMALERDRANLRAVATAGNAVVVGR